MALQSALWNGVTYSIPGAIGDTGWSGSTKVDGLLMSLAANAVNLTLAQSVSNKTFTSCTLSGASNTLTVRLTTDVTGTLPIANGGTNLTAVGTSYQLLGTNSGATAFVNLTLAGTANQISVGTAGTTITLSTPQNIHSGASPTFAGLTLAAFSGAVSASAGVLSAGTLSIGNGGTGQITAPLAFNALSPMTTLGDLLYGGSAPAGQGTRLAGNTSATKNFLTQTGNGSVSAAPVWGTIAAGDVPTLNQNTTGTANNITANLVYNQLTARPGLNATSTGTSSIGASDTIVPYATVVKDSLSNFSSNTFTCPVAGWYQVNGKFESSSVLWTATDTLRISIYKAGASVSSYDVDIPTGTDNVSAQISEAIFCSINDTIAIYGRKFTSTTPTFSGNANQNVFSVVFIGPG